MALVTKGTIEINGIVADVTEWSVSGGPSAEGKFGTNKAFLGYAKTPGVYEIDLTGLQQTGKPRIDFAKLPDGFTLIRNFANGARHQFTGTTVSNFSDESASESEYTFQVKLLAAGRDEQ